MVRCFKNASLIHRSLLFIAIFGVRMMSGFGTARVLVLAQLQARPTCCSTFCLVRFCAELQNSSVKRCSLACTEWQWFCCLCNNVLYQQQEHCPGCRPYYVGARHMLVCALRSGRDWVFSVACASFRSSLGHFCSRRAGLVRPSS